MTSLQRPFALWLLTAASYVFSVLHGARDLPARVATHFDGSGHPNGWMSHSQTVVFNLGFGLGMPAFIALVCYLIRFFPRAGLNVPNKAYWSAPENHPRACAMIFRHSLWLGILSMFWVMLLNEQILQANHRAPVQLDNSKLLFAVGLYLVGLVVWSLMLILPFRKTEAPSA